jgi:5-formyltetrahydrofolate cyclo-ligase
MTLLPDDAIALKVKAELRKRMRGLRKSMPMDACLARSQAIATRLLAHPAVQGAKSVALFYPITARHEVDLRPVHQALHERGVRLAYPAIPGDDGAMVFRFAPDLGKLEERGYGFAEPGADHEQATSLDVIVVPALAVSPSGHRLGYGAGYYDRALPAFCPPGQSIAVAFDFQLMVEVPAFDHDVRCDHIVTDTRVLARDD